MGAAVAFGMLGVTIFGLIFTPVFYVICRHLADFVSKRVAHRHHAPAPEAEAGTSA
jgi:HAE1 family hydrophobic/amphiphilic exporter-1